MNVLSLLFTVLLRPLLLTILLEGTLAFCLFRSGETVYISFLCNLLTNPVLNLLLVLFTHLLGMGAYYPVLAVLEVLVILAEGGIYRRLCQWNAASALSVSLLLNGFSIVLGSLLL